ncbi:MAG: PilT/PilU family type 4a pilus ATPase [Deltaproteobacteria bacterium]|nr:PilT/PilU family type 4a pilus ATPase [Deltaproteobacteria bacterium]
MKYTELLNNLLNFILDKYEGVSDINFSPGKLPQVEINGQLVNVPLSTFKNMLLPYQTELIALSMLDNDEILMKTLLVEGSVDLSYALPTRGRFRVNIFTQRGSYSIVLRVIPTSIPSVEELKLPQTLKDICKEKNGLVLVTGPTGSGKSTTMASLIDMINAHYSYHIITIEDPIEFLHRHKKSTINQRELGSDTSTFKSALRAALRQAPKVILVGEMRDRETIEIALEAGETGHLVISTLHTIDAPKTIDRIIGVFPKNEEAAIRRRLASAIKWVVSQRLVPEEGGGRIACVEILRTSERTRDYIIHGEKAGKSLHDVMKDGHTTLGTQTFDMVLKDYVEKGIVSLETGLLYATNANDLKVQLGEKANQPQPGIGGDEESEGGGGLDLELDVKELI